MIASVRRSMYVSSLAHVLSISGYHMAVVSGIVFFVIRAVLALVPSLAHRKPIKKWAASGALLAATFYLVLWGAEVATQRSYIMIAIVLIGVMLDRPTLTFRTARGGGDRRFTAGATGHRAPWFPDVVRGDTCPHRRIPARPSTEAGP